MSYTHNFLVLMLVACFFYIVSSRSSGRGTQAFGTAVSCPSLPIKYFCERFSRSNYNKKRGKSW